MLPPRPSQSLPVLALLVLAVAGCGVTTDPIARSSATPAPPSAYLQLPSAVESPGGTRASDASFRPTRRTVEADVTRVVDGDTIQVEIDGQKFRLRYIGIDAPETVKPSTPVEWMGPEASSANKALVDGKHVVLEKDVSESDQYGRLLRYVWLHENGTWTLVNLRLVELGYAAAVSFPPDVRYQHLLRAAEAKARAAGAGLWGPHPAAP